MFITSVVIYCRSIVTTSTVVQPAPANPTPEVLLPQHLSLIITMLPMSAVMLIILWQLLDLVRVSWFLWRELMVTLSMFTWPHLLPHPIPNINTSIQVFHLLATQRAPTAGSLKLMISCPPDPAEVPVHHQPAPVTNTRDQPLLSSHPLLSRESLHLSPKLLL